MFKLFNSCFRQTLGGFWWWRSRWEWQWIRYCIFLLLTENVGNHFVSNRPLSWKDNGTFSEFTLLNFEGSQYLVEEKEVDGLSMLLNGKYYFGPTYLFYCITLRHKICVTWGQQIKQILHDGRLIFLSTLKIQKLTMGKINIKGTSWISKRNRATDDPVK